MVTSHRSTIGSARRMNSSPSASSTPDPSSVSAAIRTAIAQSSATASRTSSIASSQKRARFSNAPPYSSVRRLYTGERNWDGR
jgi:hypothetical protein